jgi:cell division protein FtsB
VDASSPWGSAPPRPPAPGAGRAALSRRALTRGGRERRQAAAAARRALRRGTAPRPDRGRRIRGAAAELRRVSRLVEQRFLTRQRLRHVALALAGIWILWTFAIGDASLPRLWSVTSQNRKLSARIDELRVQAERLETEVRALDDPDDPAARERVARDELGYVRDGEVLVRFYDGDD